MLCAFPAPTSRISCARVSLCPSWFVQEGEFSARYEKFNITVPIPKIFHHQSFEAEEVAKELAKKIKAEEDAKEMAKKSAASKRATVAPTTKKKTHQKPANDTKTTERTTAPAPAKEDPPVTTPVTATQHPRSGDSVCSLDLSLTRRCTARRASAPSSSLGSLHSLPPSTSRSRRPRRPSPSQRGSRRGSVSKAAPFSSLGIRCGSRSSGSVSLYATHPPILARSRSGPSPLTHAYRLLTNRSFSNGAAEAAPKTVGGWSNALDGPGLFDIDAPNDDQCGLLDVGAHSVDQRKPFAPNDNQCAPDESVVASPEAFEQTEPVRIDFSRLCPEASHCATP